MRQLQERRKRRRGGVRNRQHPAYKNLYDETYYSNYRDDYYSEDYYNDRDGDEGELSAPSSDGYDAPTDGYEEPESSYRSPDSGYDAPDSGYGAPEGKDAPSYEASSSNG